ncbi:MAG: D-ribose ABC transporter substrate-binding protein [Micrococcales bacterium]|nr:D-ribose ABC transporter substrate-binding protein [Micrococcales bacterium]
MKKKLLVALVAAALITIGGCSSGNDDKPSGGGGGDNNAAGGYVAIITTVLDNPYWSAEANTAKEQLEALGYTTSIDAHNNDPQKQSELIDAALSKKAVAIVLDPAGAKESIGVVQKATDAGVPVFLINAEIEAEGIAKAQIIANNAQGAELGGQYFAEQMEGKGDFVELYGNPTDNNAPVRSDAYKSVFANYPEMNLLQTETANWVREEGAAKMEVLLTAHPDIKGVISGNDEMALGAIAAIEKLGKVPGKDIIVMGFDGSPDAVEAIKAGKLLGTVLQPIVAETEELVKQLDNFLKTGETGAGSEKQAMDCVLIIPDNIEQYGMFSMDQ